MAARALGLVVYGTSSTIEGCRGGGDDPGSNPGPKSVPCWNRTSGYHIAQTAPGHSDEALDLVPASRSVSPSRPTASATIISYWLSPRTGCLTALTVFHRITAYPSWYRHDGVLAQ